MLSVLATLGTLDALSDVSDSEDGPFQSFFYLLASFFLRTILKLREFLWPAVCSGLSGDGGMQCLPAAGSHTPQPVTHRCCAEVLSYTTVSLITGIQ